MKFTVPKKNISPVLSRAASIAPAKSSLPLIECVLIDPLENSIRICATDLETGYLTIVDGIEWPESFPGVELGFCIPAKKLHECVKNIPVDTVFFDLAGSSLTVSGGTVSYELATLPVDEFPAMPEEGGELVEVDGAKFRGLLSSVSYAQATDETKFNISGVNIRLEENETGDIFLIGGATDGHRCVIDCIEFDKVIIAQGDILKGIIIPSKSVQALKKITADGVITLSVSKNTLMVATAAEKIFCRLVDGEFPDLMRVIPATSPIKIEVSREALIYALERCRILTEGDHRKTNLKFTPESIIITSSLPVYGHASDHVSATGCPEDLEISFNSGYLLDALNNLDCDMVDLGLKDGVTPIRLNPAGTDDPTAVVMPMRL